MTTLSFVTVHDYLHILRAIAILLAPLQKRLLFYLAAAVSDFMIPLEQLPKHKMASNVDVLNITLQATPKVLRLLTSSWCPHAFVVTFKVFISVTFVQNFILKIKF